MRDAALRGWHVLDSWRGDAIAAAILIALLLSLLAAGGQLSGPGARQAEAEISRLVELLGERPHPGSADGLRLIGELVARAAATGLQVTCRFTGSAGGLTPAISETAYRLIQESLTNALKHAPGAPVGITIRAAAGDITISVVNGPAAAAPSGLERTGGSRGLAGLRERAAACGGDLTAGPADGGGWQVLARLPVQPDPAGASAVAGDRPLTSGPGAS